MPPLLHTFYPWVRYYRCGTLEDCWQLWDVSITFRPVCRWWGEDARPCVGWDWVRRESEVNTPWVGLLWMDEGPYGRE